MHKSKRKTLPKTANERREKFRRAKKDEFKQISVWLKVGSAKLLNALRGPLQENWHSDHPEKLIRKFTQSDVIAYALAALAARLEHDTENAGGVDLADSLDLLYRYQAENYHLAKMLSRLRMEKGMSTYCHLHVEGFLRELKSGTSEETARAVYFMLTRYVPRFDSSEMRRIEKVIFGGR